MTTYYLTDASKNWAIRNLTFPSDASLNIYGNTYTNSTTITNTQLGVGISRNITGINNLSIGYLVNPQLTTGTDNISIGSLIGTTGIINSRNISLGTSALANINKKTGLTSLGLGSSGNYQGFFSGTYSLNFNVISGPQPTSYPTGYVYVVAAVTSFGQPIGICYVTGVYLTYGGTGFTSSTTFSINVSGLTANSPATIYASYNNINNGNDNMAIGYNALSTTTSATYNTAIGNYALGNLNQNFADLTDNIAIGYRSQYRVIEGFRNISLGNNSLSGLSSSNNAYRPNDVICIGNNAMGYINYGTSGSTSIVIGNNAMYPANPTNNLLNNNIVIGHNALQAATAASYNVAIGNYSGGAITSGTNNVLVGPASGNGITTGSYNTFFGNTGSAVSTGDLNTFVGYNCGSGVNTGSSNVMIGNYCGNVYDNISCVFIGEQAGYSAQGNYHICIGYFAGQILGSGATNPLNNICIGNTAGQNFIGSQSIFIGYQAGKITGTGTTAANNNIGIGANAGGGLTTGTNNTIIGTILTIGTGPTTGSNITTLGYNALPSTQIVSNQITLGNSSVSSLRCQVTAITALSDARDKKDIEDLQVGLSFINKLRPVKFTWNMRPEIETDASGNTIEVYSSRNGDVEAGFIAQELDSVQEETNTQWLDIVYKDNPDRLETTQGKLIPLLVKAIQELSAKVDSLTAEIAILKAK